jgi:hypothetical protein
MEGGIIEQEIYEFLGKFILWVGSGAGGAFLLIKFLGQSWIENRFAKDLELFKAHKLHEFDLLLTRKIKWHENEYEVLSKAWSKLIDAHDSLRKAIALLKSHPDFDSMTEDDFTKWIERSDFEDFEKEYFIKEKGKRNNAYSKIIDQRSLSEAHKAFLEFHRYFDRNKIFIRPHIKDSFQKADDHIWSAWTSQHMHLSSPGSQVDFLGQAYNEESKEIRPLINEIESIIQKELFPERQEDKQ